MSCNLGMDIFTTLTYLWLWLLKHWCIFCHIDLVQKHAYHEQSCQKDKNEDQLIESLRFGSSIARIKHQLHLEGFQALLVSCDMCFPNN